MTPAQVTWLKEALVKSDAKWKIPYFHHPNWSAVIECLPGCTAPGEAPHFAPVTAGDYLMRKVAAAYT